MPLGVSSSRSTALPDAEGLTPWYFLTHSDSTTRRLTPLFKKTEVKSPVLFAIGVVALLGAIGAGLWTLTKSSAPTPIALRPTAPASAASVVLASPETAPSAPAIAYPIDTPTAAASDSAPLDVNSAITDLV